MTPVPMLKKFREKIARYSMSDKAKLRLMTECVVAELKAALEAENQEDNEGYGKFLDAAYRLKILAEFDEHAFDYLVRIKRNICPSWYQVLDKSKVIKNLNFMPRDYQLLASTYRILHRFNPLGRPQQNNISGSVGKNAIFNDAGDEF